METRTPARTKPHQKNEKGKSSGLPRKTRASFSNLDLFDEYWEEILALRD